MVIDGKGRIFEDRRGKNQPTTEKKTSLKNKKATVKKRRKEDKEK